MLRGSKKFAALRRRKNTIYPYTFGFYCSVGQVCCIIGQKMRFKTKSQIFQKRCLWHPLRELRALKSCIRPHHLYQGPRSCNLPPLEKIGRWTLSEASWRHPVPYSGWRVSTRPNRPLSLHKFCLELNNSKHIF